MAARSSPTVRRRRLSAELRRLRHDDGRTATDIAKRLEWPTSKLTRMERNEWLRPDKRDIRDLLDIYGVTDEATRERLTTLAKEGRLRGWWDPLGLPEATTTFIGLEAEAESERTSRTLVVPGLVQTADYARATMQGGPAELAADEIERRVEARMERQKILTRDDDPLRLWVVMDEAALRRMVGGPKVMAQQMRHLLEVAELAKVTFQVIPFEAGAHPGMSGSFSIIKFPEPQDLPAAYVEAIAGELFVEEPREVRQYEVAFERLTAMALGPSDTLKMIAAAAA